MIFEVPDPDFERRVRTSFARQGLNATIRATLRRVAPGQVEIEVPFSGDVSQQHGFFHGGVMGAIGDCIGATATRGQSTSPRWCPCRRLRAIKRRLGAVPPR